MGVSSDRRHQSPLPDFEIPVTGQLQNFGASSQNKLQLKFFILSIISARLWMGKWLTASRVLLDTQRILFFFPSKLFVVQTPNCVRETCPSGGTHLLTFLVRVPASTITWTSRSWHARLDRFKSKQMVCGGILWTELGDPAYYIR